MRKKDAAADLQVTIAAHGIVWGEFLFQYG